MSCPFCQPEPSRVFWDEDPAAFCLWDAFAVSPGHALVVPRRHVGSWLDATHEEHASLIAGIDVARREIQSRHDPPGFNIGVNIGEAAGQTVPHLHVHVIPRYPGDVPDPRGGVRWVIPERASYLTAAAVVREPVALAYSAPAVEHAIFGWSDRPLGARLLHDLSHADVVDIAVAFVTERGLERV